jgi:anti-sigma factor RsiW
MSSNLSEQERCDLVAYLDGELDDETSRALETKLATDADARAEMEQLRRCWDLLDFLPVPTPSENFTHRTLERLKPGKTLVQSKLASTNLPRWAFGAGWAAAVLVAATVGYLGLTILLNAAAQNRGPTEQDLVADLRVIENKRMYELVDDFEFLKELDDPDLFGDEPMGF